MNLNQLWTICPPPRQFTFPHQIKYDLKQLQLKLTNQQHSFPVFTDSVDLIKLINKDFKRPIEYKQYDPYDLITNIHYRKYVYKVDMKYYYEISRPIHYGQYTKEQSLTVQSDETNEINFLPSMYHNKVEELRSLHELEAQTATYGDILLINRRLLQHNYRAMTRWGDRKVTVFKYDWIRQQLL